ncbi:MAG: hypothetical protein KTR25_07350 [Myxococcales bacterium]|nr:hypothetical protein [Myxococcales bacterium]
MVGILKRSLPKRIWRRLGRHPVLVVATASTSIKIGRDGLRWQRGEIDGAEFRFRTGEHMGSMSGGLAGAAAGAAWGSFLPGLGTAIGAFAGGIVGEELGKRVGRLATEHAEISVREYLDSEDSHHSDEDNHP